MTKTTKKTSKTTTTKKAKTAPFDYSKNVSIVIPAYNEENGIAPTLKGLKKAVPNAEIIVIDDGSKDNTVERVKSVKGIRLIKRKFNGGYGSALKTGMRVATREYIAWFDADNEHKSDDLVKIIQMIQDQNLAAVLTRRNSPGINNTRIIGKWVLRQIARLFNSKSNMDLNCGLRVFRRSIIEKYYNILPDKFSASTTSTMVMLEREYPIAFHDIDLNDRIGTSKVKLKDGFNTILLIFRIVMLFAPMRIFLPAGFALGVVGFLYSLFFVLFKGTGIPTAGSMTIILGVLFMLMGLVADQISQMRLQQMIEGHDEFDEINT